MQGVHLAILIGLLTAMQTYTRQQLISLNGHDVTPSQSTRKAIFSLHLWQPAVYHTRAQLRWERMLTGSVHATTQSDRSKVSANKCLHFRLLNAQSIGNKSTTASLIDKEQIDILLLTETWHTSALRHCVPPEYIASISHDHQTICPGPTMVALLQSSRRTSHGSTSLHHSNPRRSSRCVSQ